MNRFFKLCLIPMLLIFIIPPALLGQMFSVEQFDDYIRDLAIFGANSIEILPPRTDDDFTNVHMQLPGTGMELWRGRTGVPSFGDMDY